MNLYYIENNLLCETYIIASTLENAIKIYKDSDVAGEIVEIKIIAKNVLGEF